MKTLIHKFKKVSVPPVQKPWIKLLEDTSESNCSQPVIKKIS